MTIRKKLILNAILGLVLAVAGGVILLASGIQISHANQTVDKASELVTTTSEMRFVTFDYLFNKTDRSFEQWQDTYKDIIRLTAMSGLSPDEQQTVRNIKAQNDATESIFMRLVADNRNPASDPDLAALQAVRDKLLASQLLLSQQGMVTDSSQLAELGRSQINQAITRSLAVILVAVIAMVVATGLNGMFMMLTISRSLTKLQKGAAAIAEGALGYRLRVKQTDEFGKLATSFNTMARKLQATEKAKSEFILLASHQLRMPLTAISWITEELLHDTDSLSNSNWRRYLRQIYESNKRMVRLIGDLLNVSQIDFGSLAPQVTLVDIPEILRGVLHDLEPRIEQKQIVVQSKVDKKISKLMIDPDWIKAILQNLISNAVKYSRLGQKIKISLVKTDGSLLIQVSDTGIGIPDNQKHKVFTKLFRADNAKKEDEDGTGLGLFITKSMVDLAGGRIWFESTENRGSTFYVELRAHQQK
jgi:signal transduction histidine kinase